MWIVLEWNRRIGLTVKILNRYIITRSDIKVSEFGYERDEERDGTDQNGRGMSITKYLWSANIENVDNLKDNLSKNKLKHKSFHIL